MAFGWRNEKKRKNIGGTEIVLLFLYISGAVYTYIRNMTAKRKISSDGVDHVYQITRDRGICFYTAADCLVWFTLLCVLARRYNIRILAVCIMLNHCHILLKAPSSYALSSFMRDLTSLFTRMYNKKYRISGSLVGRQFNNAGKRKDQKIKDIFVYICNNPVVKHAVPRAEQYRWNFLAYMQSNNPFSEVIRQESCSEELIRVMAVVRMRRKAGRPVDYLFFSGLYSHLQEEEKRQIIDYIVSEYNVIDYSAVERMWGSYQGLCYALSTVSGSEYDIREEYVEEDYRRYYRMIRLVKDAGYDLSRRRLNGLTLDEQNRLANLFLNEAGASRTEISKFLHKPYQHC